jgi:tRNA threonylcarbamoyl adenosine modification protein YeaZ
VIALALDTTTDRLSVALGCPGRAVLERTLAGARQHAAALLPLIAGLLDEAGISLAEVEQVAIADGPGGFTGLRVGAALVKALVRSSPGGLAASTASTLMVRAAGLAPPGGARVLVVTSALRGELYAASYQVALPARIETVMEPRLATVESLHQEAPDLLIADAPEKLVDRLADQFAVPLVRGSASLPRASALLSLIGVPGGAAPIAHLDDWEPTYGRPAEAQARWEAVHGRALSDPAGNPR